MHGFELGSPDTETDELPVVYNCFFAETGRALVKPDARQGERDCNFGLKGWGRRESDPYPHFLKCPQNIH